MPRYNLTEPNVGTVRGSSIKFGTPQTFRLAVSRPATTVYLPKAISDLSSGKPAAQLTPLDKSLGSRLRCLPNADQYIDDWKSPLSAGNYQVRFIPIAEELSDDEQSMDMDMDTDFNGNVAQNPEMQMDFGVSFDSVKTSTMATAFPKKSFPPPPPSRPSQFFDYGLPRPPSAPPLTMRMMLVDEIVLSKLDPDTLVVQSPSRPNPDPAVEEKIYKIKQRDLDVFKQDEWLDDTVVNYYMHLIKTRNNKNPQKYPTVYSFDSSFYALLGTAAGLPKVQMAAAGDNIFKFNIILFPVCVSHHWILVVLDNRTLTVTVYNSLNISAVKLITNNIMRYLKSEFKRLHGESNPAPEWDKETNEDNDKIPQQENPFDCGVFLLQFADYLSRDKPFDFGQIHMRYYRAKCLYECISGRLITN